MKPLLLFVVTLCVFAESKSSPLGRDGRKENLLIKCLVEVLTKVVSRQDDTFLQPECKAILQKSSKKDSSHNLFMKNNGEGMLTSEQKRQGDSNTRENEIINELEDIDEERSQEEFPNYYKRHYLTSKGKREEPDNERSQEEFPQKRHSLLFTKVKREDQDDERSQEEFPNYVQKRHLVLTSKEKRDEPDYDRSQEDFPSYIFKRYYDEDRSTEKQTWKPDQYHNKLYYDDSLNKIFKELKSQENRFGEKIPKKYWIPIQQYQHQKQDTHDGGASDEEIESVEQGKRVSWEKEADQGSEESEEREKRIWNPSYKVYHKQGRLGNENGANVHHSPEMSKHISPEEEEEVLTDQDLSNIKDNNQEKEAEMRYLTKKRNELEQNLKKNDEVYEHNPWIYRGYHHPALYEQGADKNQGLVGPSQKLYEIANALQYKMGLHTEKEPTEGEKSYPQQRILTSAELKELEKLVSAEQQAQVN